MGGMVSLVRKKEKKADKKPTLFVGKLGFGGSCLFRVGQVLGKGSFGVVRIAQHNKTGFLYALKILKKAEVLGSRQVVLDVVLFERIIWE